MKKNDSKGITLIALVITIVMLIILASVTTYSGLSTVRSSKFTEFRQELEIIQAEVDMLYEEYKDIDEGSIGVGKDLSEADSSLENEAFAAVGVTDKTGYKIFDPDILESLDIQGIKRTYIVNIKKRDVISLEGFKSDGILYYNIDQVSKKIKNNGEEIQRNNVTFTTNVEKNSNGTWIITLTDITFSNYVGKGKVQYEVSGSENWITVETDLRDKQYTFNINNSGTYTIKITDAAGQEGMQEIVVQ